MPTDRATNSLQTIDEYIASFPDAIQSRLQTIRAIIQAAAPEVAERISYQMATFTLNGRLIVHVAAWKNHIAIYPAPAGDAAFQAEVAAYIGSKSTVKLPANRPLPLDLIRQLVQYRVVEGRNEAAAKADKKQA